MSGAYSPVHAISSPRTVPKGGAPQNKRGRKRSQAGKVSATVAVDQEAVVLTTFAETVAP